MKNIKARSNLDNCTTDDTVSAVKSLVRQLFDNITAGQWDEFMLGRADKVTTQQLSQFVANMVTLCSQSTAANQGSSQATPALDVSSATAGRKIVKRRKTARGGGLKKKLKNPWMRCRRQSSSVSSADGVESAIENPVNVTSCDVPMDYTVQSVIDGVIFQAEKAAHLSAENYKKEMFDKLWPELESKDVEIAENVETVIFSDICKELAIPEHAVFSTMVLDEKHQETIISTFKKHLVPSSEYTSSSVKAPTPQKSPVKHESVPAENNSEDQIWLSKLIQTVFSEFAKISVSPSSDSLHERLLEEVWAEIQNIKVPLGPEVLEKVAKDIFSDLNEKLTALDESLSDTTVFCVFKQHLLALTDTCEVESREKEEKYRLSVELCNGDVIRCAFDKAGIFMPPDMIEAIQNRFTTVVWKELKEECVKVPLENFKNLSKLVYKSLCKKYKTPENVLLFMQLQYPIVEETIVDVFKNQIAKLSKKPGSIRQFLASARNFFCRSKRHNKVSVM